MYQDSKQVEPSKNTFSAATSYKIGFIILLLFLVSLAFLSSCKGYGEATCLTLNEKLQPHQQSLKLYQYQVEISSKTIKGIDNLSGLTWNNDTKTLFAITNKSGEILELSPQGDLLRTITTSGIRDGEAIEYLGNNEFIVSDERVQKIVKLTINENTTSINAHLAPKLTVAKVKKPNKGLEGLAYDRKAQVIYAANEAKPVVIYKITDAFNNTKKATVNLYTNANKELFVKDLSGLHYYEPYGHLLALSDESKLLVELNPKGKAISCLPLTAGRQGLFKSIRQPEGIALDDDENLYVVSEPNLFYKFKKTTNKS